MDEDKDKGQGDFATGEEDESKDADTRGTFAEGQSGGTDPAIDAPKGFFAEGQAEDEEEDLKARGSFSKGQEENEDTPAGDDD